MPFVYELKNEFSDYFCQVLLYGPKGTGKTSVCNSITEDLYGIEHKSLEHISSQYRYLQVVNATTCRSILQKLQHLISISMQILSKAEPIPDYLGQGITLISRIIDSSERAH